MAASGASTRPRPLGVDMSSPPVGVPTSSTSPAGRRLRIAWSQPARHRRRGMAAPQAPAPGFGTPVTCGTLPPPISGGTLIVSRDGTRAIAADPDCDVVYVVDLASRTRKFTDPSAAGRRTGPARGGWRRAYPRGAARQRDAGDPRPDQRDGHGAPRRVSGPSRRGVAGVERHGLGRMRDRRARRAAGCRRLRGHHGRRPRPARCHRQRRRALHHAVPIRATSCASGPTARSPASTRCPRGRARFASHVAWRAVPGPGGAVVAVHQDESTQSVATKSSGGYGCGGARGTSHSAAAPRREPWRPGPGCLLCLQASPAQRAGDERRHRHQRRRIAVVHSIVRRSLAGRRRGLAGRLDDRRDRGGQRHGRRQPSTTSSYSDREARPPEPAMSPSATARPRRSPSTQTATCSCSRESPRRSGSCPRRTPRGYSTGATTGYCAVDSALAGLEERYRPRHLPRPRGRHDRVRVVPPRRRRRRARLAARRQPAPNAVPARDDRGDRALPLAGRRGGLLGDRAATSTSRA